MILVHSLIVLYPLKSLLIDTHECLPHDSKQHDARKSAIEAVRYAVVVNLKVVGPYTEHRLKGFSRNQSTISGAIWSVIRTGWQKLRLVNFSARRGNLN